MNVEEIIRDMIERSVADIVSSIGSSLDEKPQFSKIVAHTQEVVNRLGTALIEAVMREVDDRYAAERNRKRIAVRNDKSRKLLSLMGEIELKRRLYYDKTEKRYFFAIDELFGIEKRSRIEANMKRQLIEDATLTSYGKASQRAGGRVSRQTVHNLVKAVPSDRFEVRAQGYRKVESVFIEADEDHIHLNTGKSAEVKLVYVHEGTRRVCQGRTELINPRYFVSVSNDAGEIWDEVADYLYAQYDMRNADVHISGDGAAWIKYGLQVIPKAKYHLDKFHVYKSVTNVAGANKSLRREIIAAINAKDIKRVRELYTARTEAIRTVRMRQNVADGLFYIQNNLADINLSSMAVGCAAEGHVSHVLSARMSSRPMGWSKRGAERVAKLRAYQFNGGDFAELLAPQAVEENTKEKFQPYKMRAKVNRKPSYNTVPTAHIVGLDGIKDGLNAILKAILRRK